MRPLLAASLVCALAGPALAQDKAPQDRLTDIYGVQIAAELCGFPLTDAQSEALTSAGDALEASLDLDDGAAERVYGQVEGLMTRQKASGLCAPGGPGAKEFERNLATYAR